MLYFSRWKVAVIILMSVGSILFTLPNFMPKTLLDQLPSWAPKQQMPYGLDLQGGSHLLLQMSTDELRQKWLRTVEGEVRKELRGERGGAARPDRIAYSNLAIAGDLVRVTLREPGDLDRTFKRLSGLAQPLGSAIFTGAASLDLEVRTEGANAIIVRPTDAAFAERVTNAIATSIETIRRRVDALGTTEPLIQRQGRDRILVQAPGYNDPQRLKDLINKTAALSFQLVDQSMTAEEADRGRPPAGSAVFNSSEEGQGRILLRSEAIVSGEDLVDASPGFDQRTNEPIVSFRFNAQGGRRFGQVTQANVGRPFAIVLDNEVISAPVIREPILGGTGQISGSFTSQQTQDLAIQLRSGALPASLQIVEERTVGPSLGADSIEAGRIATIVGFAGVTIFLIVNYGLFGLFAVMALVINLALITAFMSVAQSTLTLPGIAGIVLTMGMSVDANVLINERIRDELRAGKNTITAIDTAFTKAIGTITDTNMTGLLVALIMFWLGSGPVRGFAVTLGVGILASFFTATMITRYLVAEWIRRTRPTAVPIM